MRACGRSSRPARSPDQPSRVKRRVPDGPCRPGRAHGRGRRCGLGLGLRRPDPGPPDQRAERKVGRRYRDGRRDPTRIRRRPGLGSAPDELWAIDPATNTVTRRIPLRTWTRSWRSTSTPRPTKLDRDPPCRPGRSGHRGRSRIRSGDRRDARLTASRRADHPRSGVGHRLRHQRAGWHTANRS